jgi:hypothetical protein
MTIGKNDKVRFLLGGLGDTLSVCLPLPVPNPKAAKESGLYPYLFFRKDFAYK